MPLVSFVVPLHNEAKVIQKYFPAMLEALQSLHLEFELVACENGSSDRTFEQIQLLQQTHPQIRIGRIPTADYGLALKRALEICSGENVFIFNADFWSKEFVRQSLVLLKDYDVVVGSKIMKGARDRRPFVRKCITRSFNAFLRLFYGFRGTDTHGLKAFRRGPMTPILSQCITNHFIFDTELILRAQQSGLRMTEIPVNVRELRQPSYSSILARIPKVSWYLVQLWFALKIPS